MNIEAINELLSNSNKNDIEDNDSEFSEFDDTMMILTTIWVSNSM